MAGGRSDGLEVFFILTGIARLLSKKGCNNSHFKGQQQENNLKTHTFITAAKIIRYLNYI